MMPANVEQSGLGFENLFKRAKRFYCQSKSKRKYPNSNVKGVSKEAQKRVLERQEASKELSNGVSEEAQKGVLEPQEASTELSNGVSEEAQKGVPERQGASIELSSPLIGKSLEESVDRKISIEANTRTSVSNKPQDSFIRSKSKDVNEILTPEAARPEVPSGNASLQGVRNSGNLPVNCNPEICKNYALSKTLNSDKLTEIINNSIKAAVQNLANDTNPPCWRREQEQGSLSPIDSTCYNDTCTQRLESSQNKENPNSGTQYSQKGSSSTKPNGSGKICSLSANNDSKRSYNSHQRSSQRQLPTCCVPSSKSGTSSVICHRSLSKYKQNTCPCVKRQPDRPSKPSKACKPCKPCKPCKHVKADNRKMTGNVNIYICSEGNDGGSETKKKTSESTCNSMTVTNASCACSSRDVCACRSTSSSKTIRDLMKNRKKPEDIAPKCVCGKPPSDCVCLPIKSKNDEGGELCLYDTPSLNPTTSNETFREAVDYNPQTLVDSGTSPQGDFCPSTVRSRSSSQNEPRFTQQNFDTLNGVANLENTSGADVERSKLDTGNSGRGDAAREFSSYETNSNYSDGKVNLCGCSCNVKDVTNPPVQNQRERYEPQNNIDYSRRKDNTCNCCTCENDSVYSSGGKSDVDRTVYCRNNKTSRPRVQPKNKNYCKACDTQRNSVRSGRTGQRTGYSSFCIMEEDETCDASNCQSRSTKQQNLDRMSSPREDSKRFSKSYSSSHKDESNAAEGQQLINDGKPDDAKKVGSDGAPALQTFGSNKRMSVAEIAKSYSNADKSTSSNLIKLVSPVSPSSPVAKDKSVVKPKTSLEEEPRKSSLKWPFNRAKSLISGKNTPVESQKSKSAINTTKPRVDSIPSKPAKNGSMPNSITKNSDNVTEKVANGSKSASITKSPTRENSPPIVRSSAVGNSLIAIKSSDIIKEKSKELLAGSNKSKLSSSRLGSLIAERKNSVQSPSNEAARSPDDDQPSEPCYCEVADEEICTCQYQQCSCCNRSRGDCRCDVQDPPEEQPCKGCKHANRLCCCCDVDDQEKNYRTVPEDGCFRVCTLCCRPETDCCCNSGGRTPRRSRSRSNSYNKTGECCGLVCRKSQICLYCEEPRDKCTCRAPVKKCSYCGMPIDVCNCQDVMICDYEEDICQCNGRVIQNDDGGDQRICVTAWEPRRDVRKYFSRNQEERDNPDCSCCDTVRPYGSDELPYQRLSVFSDVMSELQQKISELACCNRCGKSPCCCYLQESKSYSSPTNESRVCNVKQRRSRSRSPAPYCHCLDTSPCKCEGRRTTPCQICNRCRTTPCRCRKSRSTQRKPQAKCYYCKSSPCRCESTKTLVATPKICKCSISPPRSRGEVSSPPDNSLDRNPLGPRPRSCRCRCGSSSCGSPPRGQERP